MVENVHWVQRKRSTNVKLTRLQDSERALLYHLEKLQTTQLKLKTIIHKTKEELCEIEYNLEHPFISQVRNLFPEPIIQVCKGYLLFEYCARCKKTYPAVLKMCFCMKQSEPVDVVLFGQLEVCDLSTHKVTFIDDRDQRLWKYLTDREMECGNSLNLLWQSKRTYLEILLIHGKFELNFQKINAQA